MASDRSLSSASGSSRALPESPCLAMAGVGSSTTIQRLLPIRSARPRQRFSDLLTMIDGKSMARDIVRDPLAGRRRDHPSGPPAVAKLTKSTWRRPQGEHQSQLAPAPRVDESTCDQESRSRRGPRVQLRTRLITDFGGRRASVRAASPYHDVVCRTAGSRLAGEHVHRTPLAPQSRRVGHAR